jgi:hypothetical protein
MGKIGVGVGEDFPVDDGDGNKGAGAQGPENEANDRAEFEAWKRRRDEERAYHEEKRRRHEEWHERKREFKEKVRAAARESFGRDDSWRRHDFGYSGRPRFWPLGAFGIGAGLLVLIVPLLLLVLVFSLISAAFQAPFAILALFAIALFLFMAARHSYRHAHRGPWRYYDYDDIQRPRRPQQPDIGPIITPPAATGK